MGKDKKEKIIIWIIGSNASGKTTQSKLLHKHFATDEVKYNDTIFDGEKIRCTSYGDRIGHVGLVKNNQCTGTDTINTKESLRLSLAVVSAKCDIVLVDGIMATYQWSSILNNPILNSKTFVILLDFPDLLANLDRVVQRRVEKFVGKENNKKTRQEIFESLVDELSEKTAGNVQRKIFNFRSLFNKAKIDCNYSMTIDATLSEKEIHEKILHRLEDILN